MNIEGLEGTKLMKTS